MPEKTPGANEQALQTEIARLNKIIQALMNRAERNASMQRSDFNLFQTAITLEDQVRRRTKELEAVRLENEKITRSLRKTENRNRLLIENSPVGIHEIGLDGKIIFINRAGLLMLGGRQETEVEGSLYLDTVSDADRKRISKLLLKAYAGEINHFEFKINGPHESILKSCFVPIKNKNGSVEKLMGIAENITESKKAEEQIQHFAFYDTLTQLANRRLLNDRLDQAMAVSKRNRRYGAVMFMDLDNFKPLNDRYGHNAGDLLLTEVARRISGCVRKVDTVGRFGGDEFVVILSELNEDRERSIVLAKKIAEKIRVALEKPYLLMCRHKKKTTIKHHCTASIGVVVFLGHKPSLGEIFKRADMAMYQSKEEGCNRVTLSEN